MYKFIKRNRNISIHYTTIKTIILVDPKVNDLDKFADEAVLKMGEDARGLILILAPILLRCRIAVNIVDIGVNATF